MKLGPHIVNGSETGRRVAVEGHAPLVKLVAAFDKAEEFKRAGCYVTARHVAGPDSLWREYIGRPGEYYDAHVRPHLTHPENAFIDAWETGVNEDGPRKLEGREAADVGDMAMRAAFETDIARMIKADGRAPIVGNFAVGNPAGTREEQRAAWRAYLPAMRAAVEVGGFVGIHAYANIPGWEHPLDTLFEVADVSGLATLRVIITETGLEPGWRDWTTQENHARIMIGFDQQLTARYGSRVLGAAVFQFGDGGVWERYNLDHAETFADLIIAHGKATTAPPPPPQPAPIEKPLFAFPGAGMHMILYNKPSGDITGQRFARWDVDVFETRGEWWRVTRGANGRWVRMQFA